MNAHQLIDLRHDPDGWSIGGKAAGLHRLAVAGLPVPPGRVIPAESDDAEIDELAEGIAPLWPKSTLAVRSSGVGEDSVEASFAGQFETVLHVEPTAIEIARAVRRVRMSVASEQVAAYANGSTLRMAVLVMPMLQPEAAGVAFTRDPVSGANVVVIEAVAGLADRLAAGEVSGERWTLADTPERHSNTEVLAVHQVEEIADLARRAEQLEGRAQDIEWAIADGRLHLLQARPITTGQDVEPIAISDEVPPGPWEWDSNHSRSPVSPLLADVFPDGMKRGSRLLAREYGAPLDHIALRSINGYFYTQVVPPAGKPGSSPPPAPVMRLLFKVIPALRQKERVARRAFAERSYERWHALWRTEHRPEIERTLATWLDRDLAELTADQLAAMFNQAVELQRHTFSWNMLTDAAYLVPLADLHRFVARELNVGLETSLRLVAGSSRSTYRDSVRTLAELVTPGLRSMVEAGGDVLARLQAAEPAFAAAYHRHQQRHGTILLGYDLTDPTLSEDPVAELRRVVTLPDETDDPSADARALANDLGERLPAHLRSEFMASVEAARASYWIREEGESMHSAVSGALRLVMLEVGRRLVAAGHAAEPDHAAFLTIGEITDWLRGPVDLSATIRIRRGQRRWAMHQRPPARIGREVPPPGPDSMPTNVARLMEVFQLALAYDQRPANLAPGADGVGASSGSHTGRVRIVLGPGDFSKVSPGDVLVAPITASSWEVMFPHIGALVTEGGGLLSHPAIVAREYGLPAVVGCEGATVRFRDGQVVTVNGSLGTVTVEER